MTAENYAIAMQPPHPNKGRPRAVPRAAYKAKGNTRPARRLVAVEAGLAAEIGLPLADLSLSQRVLLQAAALTIVEIERMRAAITRRGAVSCNDIVRASGQIQRLLDDLGLSTDTHERGRQTQRRRGELDETADPTPALDLSKLTEADLGIIFGPLSESPKQDLKDAPLTDTEQCMSPA